MVYRLCYLAHIKNAFMDPFCIRRKVSVGSLLIFTRANNHFAVVYNETDAHFSPIPRTVEIASVAGLMTDSSYMFGRNRYPKRTLYAAAAALTRIVKPIASTYGFMGGLGVGLRYTDNIFKRSRKRRTYKGIYMVFEYLFVGI